MQLTAKDFWIGQRVRNRTEGYGIGIVISRQEFVDFWGHAPPEGNVAVRWKHRPGYKREILQTAPKHLRPIDYIVCRGNELCMEEE